MYTVTQNTITTASKAILRNLCKQHNIKNYGKLNNAQMRAAVNNKIMQNALFNQAMRKVHQQNVTPVTVPQFGILSGIFPQVTQQQAATPAKRTKQRVKNNQWHPKIGGKTYEVWVQMRYALAVKKLPLKQAKQYVRNYFSDSDVHFNTVNAQIYRFCKYYGLTRQ